MTKSISTSWWSTSQASSFSRKLRSRKTKPSRSWLRPDTWRTYFRQ